MIVDAAVGWLDAVPAPFAVMLLAAAPVGEVRASVPVAMLHYGMGWGEAIIWSLAGNLGIVPALWWLLPRVEALVRRSHRAAGRLDAWFARRRAAADARVERNREFAVFGLIAVPLPGTGAWTAVLVAYLFGMRWRPTWRFFYAGVTFSCFLAALFVDAGVALL